MKIYSSAEAAERLGLSPGLLSALETDGRLKPKQRIGDTSYYTQCDLDNLVRELYTSLQRASWREMESRMEEVEKRLESLESNLARRQEAASSHLL